MARLEGVDHARGSHDNSFLQQLQQQLWKQYHEILLHEDLFWYQRACKDWLKFGDMNTKFFHLSTITCRKRNKIEAFLDDQDNMVLDPEELSPMIVYPILAPYSQRRVPFIRGLEGCFPPSLMIGFP